MSNRRIKIIYSGLLAGAISEGILGTIFMSPPVHRILYNPDWQSPLFLEVTAQRDLFPSIVGIVILSITHSWFFDLFQRSIPGKPGFEEVYFGDSPSGCSIGYFRNGLFTTHFSMNQFC